jgi:hypothetical protein
VPAHCRMREFDRDLIRGGHYGAAPAGAAGSTTPSIAGARSPGAQASSMRWIASSTSRRTAGASGFKFARLRRRGMPSPSPRTACVMGRSVELAIHEQRKVNLPGQRRRTGFLQE